MTRRASGAARDGSKPRSEDPSHALPRRPRRQRRCRPSTLTRARNAAATRRLRRRAAKTSPTSATETSTPASRSDESAQAFDRRGRAVRRDELLGRSSERGQQSLQGRPDQRAGEPEQRRRTRRPGPPRPRRRRPPSAASASEPTRVMRKQEALAPEAVAERRCKRRDDRRGQQPNEPGDPDGRGAALLVGEDAERDEVRPLGRDRRAPRKLGTADVGVASGALRARRPAGRDESPAD